MYGEGGCVRIERAENGYTVTMTDPAIVKKNAQREVKSDYRAPYISPQKEYVFADLKACMAFLEKNLDKALPKADYEASFDALTDDGAATDG